MCSFEPVQLVQGIDVFVDPKLLHQAMEQPRHEKDALLLCAKLCPLVFTKKELCMADGYRPDPNIKYEVKIENPLDPVRGEVITGNEFAFIIL